VCHQPGETLEFDGKIQFPAPSQPREKKYVPERLEDYPVFFIYGYLSLL